MKGGEPNWGRQGWLAWESVPCGEKEVWVGVCGVHRSPKGQDRRQDWRAGNKVCKAGLQQSTEQLRCQKLPTSPQSSGVLSAVGALPGMLGHHACWAGKRCLGVDVPALFSTEDEGESEGFLGVLRRTEPQFPTVISCLITHLLPASFLWLPSIPNPLSFPSQRSFSSPSLFRGLVWRNSLEDQWTKRHKLRLEM